jgi:nucleoside-diphosphate-sugar epimerase
MKIAITGASGFIGSLLVKKHLDLGHEVHILSRKDKNEFDSHINFFRHQGDLLNLNSLVPFLNNTTVLYHCAAEIRDESKMHSVNVEGTKNLLKVASGNVKHWVQLSSVGVYGPISSGNVLETHSYNPINTYEKTKLESDLLVIAAAENNSFTYTLIRPSNVFGYGMKNNSLFQLIKVVDKGFYFFIGAKGASANYISVSNVVQALYLAATNPRARNEIYSVSSWSTLEHFIEIIANELGKPIPKLRIPLIFINSISGLMSLFSINLLTASRIKALTNKSIYLTDKIEDQLGYKEVESMETALMVLVGFYKKRN